MLSKMVQLVSSSPPTQIFSKVTREESSTTWKTVFQIQTRIQKKATMPSLPVTVMMRLLNRTTSSSRTLGVKNGVSKATSRSQLTHHTRMAFVAFTLSPFKPSID